MKHESSDKDKPTTTHFGFEEVPLDEKAKKVSKVFDSVSGRYDIMNDLMSLGLHRIWKRMLMRVAKVRAGQQVLDVASGTGDIALLMANALSGTGQLIATDINPSMLTQARNRLLNAGRASAVHYVLADAERLPFAENFFDCITMGFGLRNVTHQQAALVSLYRVLKPGGRCLILEFSKPVMPILAKAYDTYSFSVLPRLGEWVANDRASYQYLVESIRRHPDQNTLKAMMVEAGFEGCDVHNLAGGIVAIHRGYK